MFDASNSSMILGAAIFEYALSDSATALVLAAGAVGVSLLRVTLPYMARTASAFPKWLGDLADARRKCVFLRAEKRGLRAGIPPARAEDVGSEKAPSQKSMKEGLWVPRDDTFITERWTASKTRDFRRGTAI